MRVLLACATLVVGGCTLYVAAELSGQQGPGGPQLGDCFNLANNACGQCIASNCENPTVSPPVSLKQVCSFGTSTNLPSTVQSCVADPRFANFYCTSSLTDAGVYAPSISTQGAAENNVKKCINDHCLLSCSTCQVPVPTCGSQSTLLADAGACGVCLDNAMNTAGSPCQQYVLQGVCFEDNSNPISKCAASGQCTLADCSGLSSPSTSLDDAGYDFATCMWAQCSGSCP
jgi:hypothetical protein